MSKAYDPELIEMAENLSIEMGMDNETRTGVYICLGGPSYETVAELKMWGILGVDAVGMSTVSENNYLLVLEHFLIIQLSRAGP
jgi:purine-nucleoside phosphorylase